MKCGSRNQRRSPGDERGFDRPDRDGDREDPVVQSQRERIDFSSLRVYCATQRPSAGESLWRSRSSAGPNHPTGMANMKTIVGLNCSTQSSGPALQGGVRFRNTGPNQPTGERLRPFYHSDNKRPHAGELSGFSVPAPGLTSRGRME